MSEKKSNNKILDSAFNFNFLKKLKNVKHIEIIVCIIFIALLILIYFINFSPKTQTTSGENSTTEISFTSSSEYVKNLEGKLEEVIGNIQGVENAKVLISVSSGGEVVIANNTEEKTVESSDGKSKNVTVTKTPIIVSENGTSKPIVLMEVLPKIQGVIVVAKGADNVKTKLDIYRLVEAIISISSENIQVFAGK